MPENKLMGLSEASVDVLAVRYFCFFRAGGEWRRMTIEPELVYRSETELDYRRMLEHACHLFTGWAGFTKVTLRRRGALMEVQHEAAASDKGLATCAVVMAADHPTLAGYLGRSKPTGVMLPRDSKAMEAA